MEDIKMKIRTRARIISLCSGLFLVALGFAIQGVVRTNQLQLNIENSYQRALSELSVHLDNINLNLEKARYAGTTAQLIGVASDIKSESLEAADALSQIAITDVNLETTSKFIAQTGDYANTMAKIVSQKTELSDKDRANIDSLYENSKKLSQNINDILADAQSGKLSLFKADRAVDELEQTKVTQVSALASGFQNIEENTAGLPTLIYDGPFSDNTLKKKPELTKGKKTVDRAAAKKAAAAFIGVDASKLADDGESGGNLPTYNFKVGTKSINISKSGAMVVRMVDSRLPGEVKIEPSKATEIINNLFKSKNISNMKTTYNLINKNICNVNCAYMQGDITCYTDLIKVGVALDNGEIVSYDATGYIMNHKERTMPKISVNEAAAKKNISPLLTVKKTSLALIPVGGTGEALCYEFICTDEKKNQDVIDYYNVTNGVEEQIFILLETPGGTLVM